MPGTDHAGLDAEAAFGLAFEAALGDGRLDPDERELLLRLRKALGLTPERGKELARAATEAAGARDRTEAVALPKASVLARAAELAGAEPDPEAARVLAVLREVLGGGAAGPDSRPDSGDAEADPGADTGPAPLEPDPAALLPARQRTGDDGPGPGALVDAGPGDPATWGVARIGALTGGIMLAHAGYWSALAGAIGLGSGLLYLVVGSYLSAVMAPIYAPLLTIFILGAMTDLARRREAPTLAGVWARWKPRLGSIVKTQLLMIAALPLALGLVAGAAGALVGGAVGLVLGTTLGGWVASAVSGVVAVGLAARLLMASPFALNEVLAERESGLPALASAEDLTRRNPVGVVGLSVATGLLLAATPWAFASLLLGLASLAPAGGWFHALLFSHLWPLQVAVAIGSAGVVEATGVAWTLYYLREKARRLAALPLERTRAPLELEEDDPGDDG